MNRYYKISDLKLIECGSATMEHNQIIVYINPDETEKKYLINNFQIDEHTLNSALDPDEISRIEFEPEHIAIIFKKPKNYSAAEQFVFRVISSGIFWFKDFLIIVLLEDIPIIENKKSLKINSLADVVLKILYQTIFQYLSHLKVINMVTDELETKINQSMENKYLINLFTLEKCLVYYLNAINSNGVLIEKIKLNASKIGLTGENTEFLEDIIIENNQCYKQAEIYSNILAGLMDARVSIVSNNLNLLMKTLNIMTLAIMVPTFVVSAFSMNVKIPLSSYPWAFWAIMGLALMSVICFMAFWKHLKW